MLYKILMLLVLCGVVMVFGCGEEEETLSELIVGSWQCIDQELTGQIFIPTDAGTVIGQISWTLTFYKYGRFDNVFQMSFTIADDPFVKVKVITAGTYETFDSTVVLRAESSEMLVTPPDFADFAESSISPMEEVLESMFIETLPANIQGQTLILDETRWQRI